MKLKTLGANMNEVTLGETVVFFSYNTPVAAFTPGIGLVMTEKKWSKTTSRHINKWRALVAPTATVTTKPQEYFDSMVGVA